MNYESTVRLFAAQAMAGRPLMAGPLKAALHIEVGIPASWSNKKQRAARRGDIHPTTKPDVDNTVKALFDAMNGVVWVDDVQVVSLWATKAYGEAPGVQVLVLEVEAANV